MPERKKFISRRTPNLINSIVKLSLAFSVMLLAFGELNAQTTFTVNIILPFDSKQTNFAYSDIEGVNVPQTDQEQEGSLMKIAPNFYKFDGLGMFCKFDVALDAGSSIPLRFRIGTVSEVDEIERKGPTRFNY